MVYDNIDHAALTIEELNRIYYPYPKPLLPAGLGWLWDFHRMTYGENSPELAEAYAQLHRAYTDEPSANARGEG